MRFLITEVVQASFSFSLPTLDLSACLDIYLAFDGIAGKRVLNGQSSRLHFCSLFRVDGLIDCFLDSMGYRREAMTLQENHGMIWLQLWL